MQRIGDLLRAFLAGKLTTEDERAVDLVAACRELLGDAGRHTRVKDIRGTTLVLEVDHPGWAQLVSMRKADLLRGLADKVPGSALRDLRVVVGAGQPRTAPARSSRVPVADEDPPGPDLKTALSGVQDEGLRRALRALYERARIDTGNKPGV